MGKLREGTPKYDPWVPTEEDAMQKKIEKHIKELDAKEMREIALGNKPLITEPEGSTPLISEEFHTPTKDSKSKN